MKNIKLLLLALIAFGIIPEISYAIPDFFICNYWYDANDDGYLDDDEYIGIKDSFATADNSLITFVGYYHNAKGKAIELRLYEPDGTLYSNRTAEVEYEPVHIHRWWYDVNNLANAATGRWTAYWYLDDIIQYTKTFTIIKSVSENEWYDDWFDDWSDYDENYNDYFACNEWIDKNNDDLLSRDEYIGIKDSFSIEKDTTITFVSYWHNQKGKMIQIKIYDPQGEIWYSDTATVELDPTYIYRWWFNVKRMASEGGVGSWTVKYYLDGDYYSSTIVYITKLYTSTKLNPSFFTALGWNDKNYDNLIASDYSEFVGIKDTFNSKKDTLIYFYSHWIMKNGRMRKMNIYSPKGELWKTTSSQLKSDDTYWHPSHLTSAMIKDGGKGNWKVTWYLDNKQVYTKTLILK